MRWCCVGFKAHVQAAGERGMSIIVCMPDESGPEFIIQHRATDMGFEFPSTLNMPISVVTDMRIQYCPWCGVLLNAFYGENAKAISRNDLRVKI